MILILFLLKKVIVEFISGMKKVSFYKLFSLNTKMSETAYCKRNRKTILN